MFVSGPRWIEQLETPASASRATTSAHIASWRLRYSAAQPALRNILTAWRCMAGFSSRHARNQVRGHDRDDQQGAASCLLPATPIDQAISRSFGATAGSASTNRVWTPDSLSISRAASGAARSVMRIAMRESGQTTRLPRETNFELSARTMSLSARFSSLASARGFRGFCSLGERGYFRAGRSPSLSSHRAVKSTARRRRWPKVQTIFAASAGDALRGRANPTRPPPSQTSSSRASPSVQR